MDILGSLFVRQPVALSLLNASVSRRSPLPLGGLPAVSRSFTQSSSTPLPNEDEQLCEKINSKHKKKNSRSSSSSSGEKHSRRSHHRSHRRGRDFTSSNHRQQDEVEVVGEEREEGEKRERNERDLPFSPRFHVRIRSVSPVTLRLPSTSSIFFQQKDDHELQQRQEPHTTSSSFSSYPFDNNVSQSQQQEQQQYYQHGHEKEREDRDEEYEGRICVMPSVAPMSSVINRNMLYDYDNRRREEPSEGNSSSSAHSFQERESTLRSAQELESYESRRVDVMRSAKKMKFEDEEEQRKQLAAFGFRQIAPRALLEEIVSAAAARESKGVISPLLAETPTFAFTLPSSSVLDTCVSACLLREEERVAIKERPKIILENCKPLRPVSFPPVPSLSVSPSTEEWCVREENDSVVSSLFTPTLSYLDVFPNRNDARKHNNGVSSMMVSCAGCVVIDFGSHSVKAGFGGETQPSVCEPSIVMREEQKEEGEQWVAGSDIAFSLFHRNKSSESEGKMKIGGSSSLVRSIWDAPFEKEAFVAFFHLLFKRLGVQHPNQHKLLLALPPLCSEQNKQAIVNMLFEVFHVCGLYVDLPSSLMAVYASASRTPTCVVVDLGHSALRVSAVVKGYAIDSAWHQHTRIHSGSLDTVLGGKSLSRWGAAFFDAPASSSMLCDCKAPFCKCQEEGSWLLENEMQKHSSSCALLDAIFRPREMFDDNDLVSLQEHIAQCLLRAPVDFRPVLSRNILLVGGGACVQGLASRLCEALSLLLPHLPISIVGPVGHDVQLCTWKGGSNLVSWSAIPWMMSLNNKNYV